MICSEPNSEPRKRVLFVCRQNRVRSRTAEQVYRDRPDLEVRSAGIAEYAAVPLTAELFDWADEVFVFSKEHQRIVRARFGDRADRKRMVCLGLPDRFEYKCPKLVMRLAEKLGPYLGPPKRWAPHERRPSPPAAKRSTVSSNANTGSLFRDVFSLFSSLFSGAKSPQAEPSG